MWLQRLDDGTNNAHSRVADNEKCREVVEAMLAEKEGKSK